ncbi:MAG: 1-acyl-sn-glycerol-3-phosphate acyltransferase [Actinomycetota bacterium]|nr:1-acyl-sn-glycerol-3-phosphate acyltransferase [Actinomycetota bacterium]
MKDKGASYDTEWARRPAARTIREGILTKMLGPAIDFYTGTQISGGEVFATVAPPVLLVSNHSSHLDTPIILKSLPRDWRRHTAVVAAADYFYKNQAVALLVSLAFGTIPIERARLSRDSAELIDRLISESWNLLMYPEGTRSRDGSMGRLRSGAAFLAVEHGIPALPLYVEGTYAAMPPGRGWPKHHPVTLHVGSPLRPMAGEDHRAFTKRLQQSLDAMVTGARPPPQITPVNL